MGRALRWLPVFRHSMKIMVDYFTVVVNETLGYLKSNIPSPRPKQSERICPVDGVLSPSVK